MINFFPLFLVLLLGLIFGTFVNFVVDWFYIRRKFLLPDLENAIKSSGWFRYLLWPWSIPACSLAKRFRITFVQILLIAISVWLWFTPPPGVDYWWGFGWLVYFIIVVVMDLEYRVVLHPISIAGYILGLGFGIWFRGVESALIGGAVGFGVMFLFYKIGELFIRWQSRRRGVEINEIALGFGDVNIAAVIGLILGWPGIILGLVLAILFGGVVSIIYLIVMVTTKQLKAFSAIPYAPFLIFCTFVLLYFRVYLDRLVN
jgi:prepilin signal peptidase PulO-like enzyme (type II secretory pathway)